MRTAIVLASLLAALPAAAEEPASAVDPKAAIASRGIVLKAGKRHLVVIVPIETKPPGDDPNSVFHRAKFYFGDTKTLFEVPGGSWTNTSPTAEHIDLVDPREVFAAKIFRDGDTFTLQCADWGERKETRRTIALAAADTKSAALAAKAPHKPLFMPYRSWILLRVPNSTQYYYVDRNVEPDSEDFRLFVGKRGAMKKVPVKEVALDTTALVLVTAKGTLTVNLSQKKDVLPSATFGPAKKQQTLDVIPTYTNRKLIYSELGIYTRDRLGYPCDEL